MTENTVLTLTQKQVARALGVGEANIRAAIREGRIYAIKLGRRVLVPARELERLMTPTNPNPETENETATLV